SWRTPKLARKPPTQSINGVCVHNFWNCDCAFRKNRPCQGCLQQVEIVRISLLKAGYIGACETIRKVFQGFCVRTSQRLPQGLDGDFDISKLTACFSNYLITGQNFL